MSIEHFAVLVVNPDDERVFERSEEIPSGFMTIDLAEWAIGEFLKRADDAGFSYSRDDFVIQRFCHDH